MRPAARIAVSVVRECLVEPSSIRRLIFVCLDDDVFDAYARLLAHDRARSESVAV